METEQQISLAGLTRGQSDEALVEMFRKAGMVHVTGLVPIRGEERLPQIGTRTRVAELGSYSTNNGVLCVVTELGEIWIGHETEDDMSAKAQSRIRSHFAGKGCFVHCSQGEIIDSRQLLIRLSSPYWMPA